VAGAAFFLHLAALSAEELVISERAIVNTGHHIYQRMCAVCHGRDSKGNGPYAPMLTRAPPDLTVLSGANNGRFPFDRVFEIISGNELMPGHGTRDMPIWGQEFANEAEMLGVESRVLARGRMLELMSYLEHVQQK
jgi:mono/diheme cytochrome c family protein